MNRLSGKTAIITGAAQGMGAAHARMFVEEGAKVLITDISDAAGPLADELGANALFVRHDVTDEAGWKRVVQEAEARFGTVNVLVNNAGILGPIVPTVELSQADFLHVCAVNQLSLFLGMQAVIPSMVRAGGGSIVNISSISGMVSIRGTPMSLRREQVRRERHDEVRGDRTWQGRHQGEFRASGLYPHADDARWHRRRRRRGGGRHPAGAHRRSPGSLESGRLPRLR